MRYQMMRERVGKASAVVFALALLAGTARAQDEARYIELPNFHQVNAQLISDYYRDWIKLHPVPIKTPDGSRTPSWQDGIQFTASVRSLS